MREVAQILQAIKAGFNVLVVGQRGSGKTSLLNHVEYRLKDDPKEFVVPVFALSEIKTAADFIWLLARMIHNRSNQLPISKIKRTVLRSLEILVGGGILPEVIDLARQPSGEMTHIDQYRVLDEFVNICTEIKHRGIQPVFLIDEADKMPDLIHGILSSLRDTLWRTGAVYVLTCDEMTKPLMLRPPVDSFFERIVELHPLSYDEMVDFIRKRLKADLFPHEVYKMIHLASNGIPRNIVRTSRMIAEKHADEHWSPSDFVEKASSILKHDRAMSRSEFLSRSERLVMQYVQDSGPSSASDKNLQTFLAVKRARLVQILTKLERLGFLKSTQVPGTRRKLYSLAG